MLRIICFISFFLSLTSVKAQSPDAQLLVKIEGATTSEINAITGAEEGMLTYDTSEKKLKTYDGINWSTDDTASTIILNRVNGGAILNTATNTYFDLPLTAAHTQVNTGSAFTIVGTSEIRINQDGVYLISAALSTSNMPSGSTKYILAARRNGALIGYLTRGFVTLPNVDFWGASGTLMYQLSTNDVINIQYVINAGGSTLNNIFSNAAITKL